MTNEELQEIETLHREYVRGNKPIPDWLGPKSTAIRAIGLAHCLVVDYRAAVALAEHIQTDLEAMHRANARAEARIADLREDLARARQVNTQAEQVRDENERLRRDLGWHLNFASALVAADVPCSHPAAMRQSRLPSGSRCGACDETFS